MSNELEKHIREFLDEHKQQVDKSQVPLNIHTSKSIFNAYQAHFFDEQAHCYLPEKDQPKEVKENLIKIIEATKIYCQSKKQYTILDVGSGAGVLIPYIKAHYKNSIVHAIDLSTHQLQNLQKYYPEIVLHQGDISFFSSEIHFDLIICNACFGNFYSQQDALENMSRLLSDNGIIAISHPVGAKFVEKLHMQDPNTVPHVLPVIDMDVDMLCESRNLQMELLINEEEFYLLILRKVLHV